MAEPLGLKAFTLGVPAGGPQGDIQTLVAVGEVASPDELEAALGIREIPVGEVTEAALLGLNQPLGPARRAARRGAPCRPRADVARFYQGLLHNPGGLWDPEVLARRHHRWSATRFPDLMMGTPVEPQPWPRPRRLTTVRSNLRGMGRTVSPGTFGHNGAGGQIAWADPATGLSFCYVTNGLDRNFLREHRRTTALASLAGVCASLTRA